MEDFGVADSTHHAERGSPANSGRGHGTDP